MNATLTADTVITAPDRSTRLFASAARTTTGPTPAASTLSCTRTAVQDAFSHLPTGAVLSVPVGSTDDHFDVVQWCASNGKRILNRFDPWPLPALLIENSAT